MVINYREGSRDFETLHGYKPHGYTLRKGQNGCKYVDVHSVPRNNLHISLDNSKTGPVMAWNFPIEYTCKHNCECYKKKLCYACGGCYLFASNQAKYSENLAFYNAHDVDTIVKAVQYIIDSNPRIRKFRAFTCGDLPGYKFLDVMRKLARKNPAIKFWLYTKKYSMVNKYSDIHGFINTRNFKVIFSHWRNEDGTYYPMENPYHYPTSEFIPAGMEDTIPDNAHVCPCSNPDIYTTCADCENPCYELAQGQAMCLLEHSTQKTKERDKRVRIAHERIKESKRKGNKNR